MGKAQYTAGQPPLPAELKRTSRLSLSVRPGEHADLQAIADAWDVPLGVAAWSILSRYLAECRGAMEADLPGEATRGMLRHLGLLGDASGCARCAGLDERRGGDE